MSEVAGVELPFELPPPTTIGPVPEAVQWLLRIRFMPDRALDPFDTADLERAVRWLYLARYSCLESIRKLQRVAAARDTIRSKAEM